MYKKFYGSLPPKSGRMHIGDWEKSTDPAEAGDTVTLQVFEGISFRILVEDSTEEVVKGEIVDIDPNSNEEYEGWSVGEKIEISTQFISGIIRAN